MIESWFPTLIYNHLIEFEHNQHLKKVALDVYEKSNKNVTTKWACDTFNTIGHYDYRNANDPVVNNLVEIFRSKVYEFSKVYGITLPVVHLHCKDLWFNVAEPGAYQEYHQHTRSHFSLTYYVDVPTDCGKIRFRSFEALTDMYTLPIESHNENLTSWKTCAYEPVENLLLIFRSNLPHMVEKNLSDKRRISISANFEFA